MLPLRLSRLAVLAFSLPTFVACGYGDHPHHDVEPGDDQGAPSKPGPDVKVESATIDVDQALEIDPGAGAGAFIEYQSGGTYRVTTSCDVSENGDCRWDIIVAPLYSARVLSAAPGDLEEDDTLTFSAEALRLVANTGKDFDGFSFQTEPGAVIEVDALLDEGAGNRYLFWVGDGALHSGAPSNPVELVPSGE